MTTGVWYHIAAVYDAAGQTMKLYLDGAEVGSRTVSHTTLHASTADFMLGANIYEGNAHQFFDGVLDEWRVYAEALDQSAIQDLMDEALEPISGLTVTSDSPTEVGASTSFTATVTAGSDLSYVWDFGDGSPVITNGAIITYSYSTAGNYTTTITATNNVSSDTATTTVTIETPPPVANFGYFPTAVDTNDIVLFLNTSTNASSYLWSFGDGLTSTLTSPTHTYTIADVYTVTLAASNGTITDTAADLITVTVPMTQPATLRGYWKLEETSGTRDDETGHNDLTDNGGVGVATGRIGSGADLEAGSSQYLSNTNTGSNSLVITDSLTLVGWMQLETLTDPHQIMAAKYGYGTGINRRAYRFDVRDSGTILGFIASPDGLFKSDSLLEATVTPTLTTGAWYHVAAVFDAGQQTMTIYLDGAEIGARTVSFSTLYDTSDPFMLGADVKDNNPTQFFDGVLDEWRVYAAALDQSEIQDLMALTEEPVSGLTLSSNSPQAVGQATTLTATISSGSNITYTWNFGDGSPLPETSTGVISHTYATSGVYPAVVTAANTLSSMTATTTVTVTEPLTHSDWQVITTTLSPPVNGEQAMMYDSQRDVVVLYGGNAAGWPYESEVWEFDGSAWLTVTVATAPEARYGSQMAYLPGQGGILFGGSDANDAVLSQTWQFTNATWSELTPSSSPPARTYHSLAGNPISGTLYLFGGNDETTYFNDLWRYENDVWSQLSPPSAPSARTLAALAYLPPASPLAEGAAGSLLLFGVQGRTGAKKK